MLNLIPLWPAFLPDESGAGSKGDGPSMGVKTAIQKVLGRMGLEIVRRPLTGRALFPRQGLFPQTLYEMDETFHVSYERAQEKTQMQFSDNALRRQRHYNLSGLLKQTLHARGDFCEIGCWRGLSAYETATFIQKNNLATPFHLFDSFEGLSDFTEADRQPGRRLDEPVVRQQFKCSLEEVERNLADFGFISYYKGWVPTRFKEVKDCTFRWVHIDVDLYQPVKECFAFFYPRLAPGGVMVFDDYGCAQFPGAKRAVDECRSSVGEGTGDFFLPLVSGQAFLLKHS